MKSPHLAPAVLASVAAAGLVLAPAAAFAQTAPEPEETQTAAPTAAQQKAAPAEPSQSPSPAEEPAENESPAEEPEAPAQPETDESEAPSDPPAEEPEESAQPEESDEPTAPAEEEPEVTVEAPAAAAVEDVAQIEGEDAVPGVTLTVSGLPEGTQSVSFAVTGGAEGEQTLAAEPSTAEDGTVSGEAAYTFEVPADADLAEYAGTRAVAVIADGKEAGTTSFDITPPAAEDDGTEDEQDGEDSQDDGEDQIEDEQNGTEDEQAGDPALTVPSSIAIEDLAFPLGEVPDGAGLAVSASGLEPGEQYSFDILAPEGLSETLDHSIQVTADEQGNAAATYYIEYSGDVDLSTLAGTYTVELVSGEDVLDSSTVTVTHAGDDDAGPGDDTDDGEDKDSDDPWAGEDDEATYEAAIAISPRTVSSTDFINANKGVEVTASGCEPGTAVGLEVYWPDSDEVAYAAGDTADDEGRATFSFYGTGSNPDDYVGTWKTVVTCSDTSAAGTFEVTGSRSSGGQDGSSLPRTGVESGGLAVAAATLIAVGSATVMLSTRRQMKRRA
ncbi:hypothetical protein [Brevibacterium album]|uniref:hypothetical protein n=1 Tax=Brevibacterium album TaxID=417948 RepID=UPI000428DAEC|nr:hypothetical protein [Brevibacterium album]